jgi:hypothetical protein
MIHFSVNRVQHYNDDYSNNKHVKKMIYVALNKFPLFRMAKKNNYPETGIIYSETGIHSPAFDKELFVIFPHKLLRKNP